MPSQILKGLTAAAGLFASLSSAAPLQKREVVWETKTAFDTKTLTTTTTVPGVPGAPTTITPTAQVDQPIASPPPVTQGDAASQPEVSALAPTNTNDLETRSATTAVDAPEQTATKRQVQAGIPAPVAPPAPPAAPAVGGGSQCSKDAPCSGDLTFYDGGTGSCGFDINTASDNIVAIPEHMMGDVSNGNPLCGKEIMITFGGKQVKAKIGDKCKACVS